jgi:hypothetical protein
VGTDRPHIFEDTRDLLVAFEQAQVEYVIVGAHALAAHGLPRATTDFDVLVRPSQDNAERVMQALIAFGAPVRAHSVSTEDFVVPGTVYQIGLPPRRIDVLTRISGVDFDDAWRSRLTVTVDGLRLPVLGRDALIKNKIASGRKKDLLDVEALRTGHHARAKPDDGA